MIRDHAKYRKQTPFDQQLDKETLIRHVSPVTPCVSFFLVSRETSRLMMLPKEEYLLDYTYRHGISAVYFEESQVTQLMRVKMKKKGDV